MTESKRDRKEYMKEWQAKKKLDPEYQAKIRERRLEYYYKRKESMTYEEKEVLRLRNNEYSKEKRRKDPRQCMLAEARKRAKSKQIEYNLELEDIHIPDKCPVLGLHLAVSSGKRSAGSPSLDRIDNSKGYTKDNICVISLRANALKNDATIEELEKIVNYMKEKLCHGMELKSQLENE